MIGSKNNVLIIEDEVSLAKIVSFKLEKLGYKVTIANDGDTGIQNYRKNRPDMILLDLIMAKVDGFSVLKIIGDDLKKYRIPVLVMTNLSSGQDEKEVRDLGASDYIVKSNMSLDQLVERASGLLIS